MPTNTALGSFQWLRNVTTSTCRQYLSSGSPAAAGSWPGVRYQIMPRGRRLAVLAANQVQAGRWNRRPSHSRQSARPTRSPLSSKLNARPVGPVM